MSNSLLRVILTTIGFGLVFTSATVLADPVDPILMDRLTNVPKSRPWPITWFEPKEIVPGAPGRIFFRPTEAGISSQALAAALDYSREQTPGALLVWHNGAMAMEAYFGGAGPSTLLNPYYMHQTALTLLFGIAIQEGKIGSLDDSVARFLPEWSNDARSSITIRHLLTMSAGLELYQDSINPQDKAAKLFFGSDRKSAVLTYQSKGPAGSQFAYNYAIPEILGLVLQRAVKQRYADYLSSRLWRPLGNGDAQVWLDRPKGEPLFNGALFARATDWLALGELILNHGRVGDRQIVPASWVSAMTTPSPTNPNYGMIWLGAPFAKDRPLAPGVRYVMHASEPYAADDVVFMDGYGGQRVYIIPSRQIIIVRIGAPRRDNWDDARLPNLILGGIAP